MIASEILGHAQSNDGKSLKIQRLAEALNTLSSDFIGKVKSPDIDARKSMHICNLSHI